MPRYTDLTGLRFNRLTVLSLYDKCKDNETRWLCKCECGNQTIARRQCLRSNHTKSCGCLRRENGIRQLKSWR